MTTFPPETAPGSPAAAVAAARDVLGGLEHVVWAGKSPAELLTAMGEIEALRSRLAAVQAEVAVEIDATGAAGGEHGWASTGDYLTAVSGRRRSAGQRILKTSKGLCETRHATRRALFDGAVSPEHADVIVRVVSALPGDSELRDAAERLLLNEAAHCDATELEEAGRRVLEVLDPDGSAKRDEKKVRKEERSAHLNRFLSIIEDGLGGVRVKGSGTVEDAAILRAVLTSLSAPQPSTDPEHGTAGRDPRDHGARAWDALITACQTLADAEVLPAAHGLKPRIRVTVGFEDLRDELGLATLETGERLSAASVRKLACDADIIPIVLGTDGQVLDVGRAQRLVTAAVWEALVARDHHCRFPGCRRPPIACDAHHVKHWIEGGNTSLDNMVLLCRAHHTIIHSTGWEVRMSLCDRHPEFRPPLTGRRPRPPLLDQVDEDDDGWIRERTPRARPWLLS